MGSLRLRCVLFPVSLPHAWEQVTSGLVWLLLFPVHLEVRVVRSHTELTSVRKDRLGGIRKHSDWAGTTCSLQVTVRNVRLELQEYNLHLFKPRQSDGSRLGRLT